MNNTKPRPRLNWTQAEWDAWAVAAAKRDERIVTCLFILAITIPVAVLALCSYLDSIGY